VIRARYLYDVRGWQRPAQADRARINFTLNGRGQNGGTGPVGRVHGCYVRKHVLDSTHRPEDGQKGRGHRRVRETHRAEPGVSSDRIGGDGPKIPAVRREAGGRTQLGYRRSPTEGAVSVDHLVEVGWKPVRGRSGWAGEGVGPRERAGREGIVVRVEQRDAQHALRMLHREQRRFVSAIRPSDDVGGAHRERVHHRYDVAHEHGTPVLVAGRPRGAAPPPPRDPNYTIAIGELRREGIEGVRGLPHT
jgi:hypothetical protein